MKCRECNMQPSLDGRKLLQSTGCNSRAPSANLLQTCWLCKPRTAGTAPLRFMLPGCQLPAAMGAPIAALPSCCCLRLPTCRISAWCGMMMVLSSSSLQPSACRNISTLPVCHTEPCSSSPGLLQHSCQNWESSRPMAAKKSCQACRGTASSAGLRRTVARTCTKDAHMQQLLLSDHDDDHVGAAEMLAPAAGRAVMLLCVTIAACPMMLLLSVPTW